jgi:indolepyruvate ferredoxin oxidoreductase beta subunit
MRSTGILLVGVAGQGVETWGRLLGQAALEAGLEVTVAVERTMARGGGSASCQVRLSGGEIRSPVIPEGEADLLLALEQLEAVRAVHRVRPGGFAAVADVTVKTPRMRMGLDPAHGDLLERLRARVARVARVEGPSLGGAAGPSGEAGAVLLGLAGPLLPVPAASWDEAVLAVAPADQAPAWRAALARGRALFDALPESVRRETSA